MNWTMRVALIATSLLLATAVTAADKAAGAVEASAQLPGVGSDGLTLPLTADQLDPAERKSFEALQVGSVEARQFLYTRGYLRYCKQVVDGTRAPLDLPPLPKRENWNRNLLSNNEATDIVDVALSRRIAARLPPERTVPPIDPALFTANALPAIDADGRTGPLKVDQLTVAEKATYASLQADSVTATQFLHVRGYLRFCRLVIAGTIQPLQLPKLPARENWSREHLSNDEARDILDVALGMKLAARMTPAPAP